jgi:thiamine-phosphate pyrophosphorylase
MVGDFHEGLRTRAAKLAAAARALKEASGAAAPFCLAFMTDRRRIANPEPILRALPEGAAVLYRDYDDPRREATARRYRTICAGRGVLFLVAGDAALAMSVGADGVHWPTAGNREWGAGNGRGRRFHSPLPIPKSRLIVTAAAHNGADLARAARLGACLALLSPVFPTQSHPGAEHLGLARFKALAAAAPVPVLALGGVDDRNASALAGSSVAGMAGIGAFVSA